MAGRGAHASGMMNQDDVEIDDCNNQRSPPMHQTSVEETVLALCNLNSDAT